MTPIKPVISDIQTTALFYYDPAFSGEGYQFCLDRDIDCLPSLDDPQRFYQRDDQNRDFKVEKIPADRRISRTRHLFHPDLLQQFRKFSLLFVIDDDELSGVVHFSDYNKTVVSNYLFTQLANYERNLRRLAVLSDLSEIDMEDYFQQKLQEQEFKGEDTEYFQRKLDAIERLKNKSRQPPPFQTFYLDDLRGLLKHKGVISLRGKVIDLRNSVMHAHEFVNMVDMTTPDYIYDFATFKTFFKRVHALLDDARRVENRIRFIESRVEGRILGVG